MDTRRKEALIRFGFIGADVLADDDDVVIVIAPQNGTVATVYMNVCMHEFMNLCERICM